MGRLLLFYRLVVRPLFHEPVRSALTVLAIALGVGVVLAIELAGNAAAGSFQSSMETLAGRSDLEIFATGGVPEAVVGTLQTMPYAAQVSPRVEGFAVISDTKRTVAVIGLDLIAEGSNHADLAAGVVIAQPSDALRYVADDESVWSGASLGHKPGDSIDLLINDEARTFIVRGVYPDSNGNGTAIVMDIAAAQRALRREGRVDRILLKMPASASLEEWEERLQTMLPPGIQVRPVGTGTAENRRMLGAFRWNLRLLSYIALVVGAFLIYNTISVSVVRRRTDIGIARALGASKPDVLGTFVAEAAFFGLAGGLLGLPLGRLMANDAVRLIATTVKSLYVSSQPGRIELDWKTCLFAICLGIVVAAASAFAPAREASQVPPIEAMARGRREYITRVHAIRDLWIAALLGVAAAAASRVPAIGGKPLFGYLASVLLIAASAMVIPAMIESIVGISSRTLGYLFGVEALLASRSLAASLRRTSILVGALSTSIAMMTAVGVMVGSFRQTVLTWMGDQLPADLYLRPAGGPAADRHPTISPELVDTIAGLPGVAAIDRLREYEISFEGMPASLASVDLRVLRSYHSADFLSGRPTEQVLTELRGSDTVIVSEPFANKHHVGAGDSIPVSLGESRREFRIVDVYYDYSSERGSILMDRQTMLRYLPDPMVSNLAIYVAADARPDVVRAEIEKAAAGHRILVFSNRDLRTEALLIFDRTFSITYALEAVAVIIAVMGVAGAMLALVLDRRRELGLLRFLGAARGQIRKLIVMEAGLIGLLGTLEGVVLGFAMSLILIYVINKQSFGWTIRFHSPVAVLLGALSIVYVATVVAGLYPARVAARLNPVEVVHEE